MSPTTLTLILLACYFVYLGWKSKVFRESPGESGIRNATQLENVFSLFAVIGAGEYILAIGLVFTYGVLAPTFLLALSVSLWLLSRYSNEIRRTLSNGSLVDGYRHYSLPDYLYDRMGSHVSRVSTVITVFAFTVLIQLQFTAGAKLLNALSEMPYKMGVLLLCVTLISYLWLGGMSALLHTDVWQGILMWIGLVLVVVYILFSRFDEMATSLVASVTTSIESFKNIESDPTLLSIFILTLAAAFAGPDFWQRIAGFSENDKESKLACNRAAWTILFFAIPTSILAVHASSVVPADSSQPLIDYMTIVVRQGSTILPVLLQMTFSLGLLAAFLSTADTSAMLVANVVNAERLRKLTNSKRVQSMKSIHYFIFLLCMLSAFLSIFYTSLTETFLGVLGILSSQGLPVFAVVNGRGNKSTVLLGILGGSLCALLQTYAFPLCGLSAYTSGWWVLMPLLFGVPALITKTRRDAYQTI
jgi:Na+/proline symporter